MIDYISFSKSFICVKFIYQGSVMETKTLAGQYALITGGAGDIGAEIARTLAEAGASIALLDKNKSGLMKVAEQFKAKNYPCYCLEVDLKDVTAIEQAVEELYHH